MNSDIDTQLHLLDFAATNERFPLPIASVEDGLELSPETARWHARNVRYVSGSIERVLGELPMFEMRDFKSSDDGPANPALKSVVRLPRTRMEREIPVGIVSNSYCLAQHAEVTMKCLEGMRMTGIDPRGLRAEAGLTELGEWMNLRIYFPESFKKKPADKNDITLRLECFNSVDGSSRLVVLLGWIRFICSNGMVIGETKADLRDVHDGGLDLNAIVTAVTDGLKLVKRDLDKLRKWEGTSVTMGATQRWADKDVATAWGKKAASRLYHICASGRETELENAFEGGAASAKKVRYLDPVPGARSPIQNLYDVSQALSWVATRRNNPEQRVDWQSQIPALLVQLGRTAVAA